MEDRQRRGDCFAKIAYFCATVNFHTEPEKKLTSENGSRAVVTLTTLARVDSCGHLLNSTLNSRKGGVFSRYYNDDNVGVGCWIIMG